ncbi:group II truncated hemoglobin [Sphingomonadaceae bacterium jetA1]|uniref:group II truncated hemoglobin n=1 Tax=Facivitalis istanbulensis TaxID=3075838 RepID=UPI00347770F2
MTMVMDPPPSLFDRIGGAARVRGLSDRFYDLMEAEERYAALRALHGEDLTEVRESLAVFLGGWLGGPRIWFSQRPGTCIMTAHRALGVTPATAGQWLHAMGRAIDDEGVEQEVATAMRRSFARMAAMMIANGQDEG